MASRNIWVISDTHFSHTNILNFTDYTTGEKVRKFYDIHHMNEYIIDRWNRTVNHGDIVYHLGDVFFGPKEDFKSLWPRLKGRKRLIVGNHDDIKFMSYGGFFQKVMMWRKFPEFNALLTHVPVHDTVLGEGSFKGQPVLNVHGHIHSNPSPTENHKCVCVEQTDYMPVNLEDIRDGKT